jgi:hypothetical protein
MGLPEFHRICGEKLDAIQDAVEEEAEDKLGEDFDMTVAVLWRSWPRLLAHGTTAVVAGWRHEPDAGATWDVSTHLFFQRHPRHRLGSQPACQSIVLHPLL